MARNMIHYVQGDATRPNAGDPKAAKVIAHVVNDVGGWGKGFVLALTARFGKGANSPEKAYRDWYKNGYFDLTNDEGSWQVPFVLGQIQIVDAAKQEKTFVANMIAQRDYGTLREQDEALNLPNIRYDSLLECLLRLHIRCDWYSQKKGIPVEIHSPRFGAGLAGGRWSKIEEVIKEAQKGNYTHKFNIDFFVYDRPGQKQDWTA